MRSTMTLEAARRDQLKSYLRAVSFGEGLRMLTSGEDHELWQAIQDLRESEPGFHGTDEILALLKHPLDATILSEIYATKGTGLDDQRIHLALLRHHEQHQGLDALIRYSILHQSRGLGVAAILREGHSTEKEMDLVRRLGDALGRESSDQQVGTLLLNFLTEPAGRQEIFLALLQEARLPLEDAERTARVAQLLEAARNL